MANLGELLKRSPEKEMDWLLNSIEVKNDLRGYNGLSGIGVNCIRKLQLAHYDCYMVSNSIRMLRLFNEGHRMEPVLTDILDKALGIEITSDQEEVVGFAGHWKGHIDGKGRFRDDSKFLDYKPGEFLVEFKTHNDKSFKDMQKNGVKKSKPMHYGQVTSYMGYNKLEWTLYIAYNKNDSEIYIEWIQFDPEYFRELQRKEAEVVTADSLLPRIGNDKATWFECKLCDAVKVCFGKKPIKESCKNCTWVDVHDEGVWECTKHKKKLQDFKPCDIYTVGEMFWELS